MCLTLVLGVAAVLTVSMALIGVALGGALGRSLILFSPWVALALVQELWRASLFRDQRGRGAAINDGVWAAGMLVMLPFAWLFPSEWMIAATWGVGAAVAAIFGVFQLRVRPAGVVTALRWWKTELRVLGSWLAIENLILTLGTQALVFVLAAQLGAGDLGGIRAVEVVFAPMSLFGEAFAFPGTPIVARALASSLAGRASLGLATQPRGLRLDRALLRVDPSTARSIARDGVRAGFPDVRPAGASARVGATVARGCDRLRTPEQSGPAGALAHHEQSDQHRRDPGVHPALRVAVRCDGRGGRSRPRKRARLDLRHRVRPAFRRHRADDVCASPRPSRTTPIKAPRSPPSSAVWSTRSKRREPSTSP